MPAIYSGDGDLQTIGSKADAPASSTAGKASVVALLKGLLYELGDEEGDSDLITELRAIRIGMERLIGVDAGDLLAMAQSSAVD